MTAMSVSLDDIWAEDIQQSPSRAARNQKQKTPTPSGSGLDSDDDVFTRPSKRSRSSLFLAGSDDEDDIPQARTPTRPRTQGNPDIDHLFEDLEDDYPRATSTSKPFDLNAVRREARREVERNYAPIASSSPSRMPIMSSSPPRDGLAQLGKGEEEEKKKRPKLDEERLLGKDGFPALIKMCKGFKPKGKGHELSDLNRLFTIYQFWTHRLYPKTAFDDTTKQVEKLCHKKRMHAALGAWKDEFHGTVNGIKLPTEDIDMGSDVGDDEISEERRKQLADDVFGPVAASSSRASSEAPTHPPSSASEGEGKGERSNGRMQLETDEDDPFDIDAILAEEEQMMYESGAGPAKLKKGPPPPTVTDDFNFPDDEEALWAEMHGGEEDASRNNGKTREAGKTFSPPSVSSSAEPQMDGLNGEDNTDDMWEILDETEREKQASTRKSPVASEPTVTLHGPEANVVSNSNDDEWDDMYVEDS